MHDLTETIVAVATPVGRGGVGCVRLSGTRSAEISRRLFRPSRMSGTDEAGRARFGRFVDADGVVLDHGFRVRFSAGSSFTGEDVAELWPHGSPAVLAALVEGAVRHGAVVAAPGEFTYRAFRHGRLDLAGAEAVRDLVEARTRYQARVALQQAEGALASCRDLADGFRFGRVVREGARLAIVGRPNAGKSSLFNRLLVRERAIVADVPGTTRDTLEEGFEVDGVPITLVDTAGLRDTADEVEREGVRRAEQARLEADLVVHVLDGAAGWEAGEAPAIDDDRTVTVVNKCDRPEARERALPHPDALRVSARTGEGIGALRRRLAETIRGSAPLEDPVVTHARHADALRNAVAALDRAARASREGLSEELVLEDLRAARRELGTITGEFGTEDLYDRIFSTFCIGK